MNIAAFPLEGDDLVLRYIALWGFVLGASLVWLVMHLRRNASFRKTAHDNKALKTKIKGILQFSREILYGFDVQSGSFDYLSPSCYSLTGYSAKELEKMGLEGLLSHVHPEDQENIRRIIKNIGEKAEDQEWLGVIEYRFEHRDGYYRTFSDHLHVSYSKSGGLQALHGFLRDVTQITQLEDNLRILGQKFNDSQKMAGLGLLASGIAHDFNNLMTVILGNTELALLECERSDCGLLNEVKQATLRAAELANQMLVYAGKTALVTSSVNLGSIVKEMGALLDVSISKKVRIEYCFAEDVPLIRGDVSQIRQVVMNLITNASEAIGDRSGVIAISIHEAYLGRRDIAALYPPNNVEEGRYIMLEVSDTGDGMSKETLQNIFDPLFTTKITGRGLGLASLLNAVEQHNGAVNVSSEAGKGTIFRVYFPLSNQPDVAPDDDQRVNEDAWRGHGTALVVDDESAILDVTKSLIERNGFRVVMASDGLAAVDVYQQYAEEISLILIDIKMPRLDGLEAISRIRHINPNVPVLFMSGYPPDELLKRFKNHPHTDFLKKPFQSNELVSKIRSVMDRLA